MVRARLRHLLQRIKQQALACAAIACMAPSVRRWWRDGRGALAANGADVAVAISGVAGPDGGSTARPVGLVCFAMARAGETRTEERRFGGDREAVRRAAVAHALALIAGATGA
jgi:hypothetical protein